MSLDVITQELMTTGVKFDISKYEALEVTRMKSELDDYLSVLSEKLGQTLYLENCIQIYQLLSDNGIFVRDLSQEYLKNINMTVKNSIYSTKRKIFSKSYALIA